MGGLAAPRLSKTLVNRILEVLGERRTGVFPKDVMFHGTSAKFAPKDIITQTSSPLNPIDPNAYLGAHLAMDPSIAADFARRRSPQGVQRVLGYRVNSGENPLVLPKEEHLLQAVIQTQVPKYASDVAYITDPRELVQAARQSKKPHELVINTFLKDPQGRATWAKLTKGFMQDNEKRLPVIYGNTGEGYAQNPSVVVPKSNMLTPLFELTQEGGQLPSGSPWGRSPNYTDLEGLVQSIKGLSIRPNAVDILANRKTLR
jgi:hypothetical protein